MSTDGTVTACIDVHSHFFPLEVLDALRTEGARYRTPVRTEADGRVFVVTPERPYGPIVPGFYAPEPPRSASGPRSAIHLVDKGTCVTPQA